MSDTDPAEGHRLVAVHAAANDSDAQVVLALLRAHGIEGYEENTLPHSVYPVPADSRILVHEDDAEAARAVIAARPDENETAGE